MSGPLSGTWADSWQELLATLGRNPVRTGLTAAGVAWGMFLLVLMSGFGSGLEDGVRQSMGRRATNAVYFWGRRTTLPWQGNRAGRPVRFRNSDLDAIAEQVEGIKLLAAGNQLGGWRTRSIVTVGEESGSFEILGSTPDYAEIQPTRLAAGRFLNPLDLQQRRRVAVVGSEIVRELYPPDATVVGTEIEAAGAIYTVVGVFASRLSGDDGERAESSVWVPITTFQQAYNQGDRVSWMAFTGEDHVDANDLEASIRAVLLKRHGVHPDDRPALGSRNGGAEFARIQRTFVGIRAMVLFVGGMTVLAGAFGVTNVMLVSVRERTREFGLRRAVGATQAQIRLLVLREAVLLTLVAGELGLLAGVGVLEVAGAALAEGAPGFGTPRLDAGLVVGAAIAMVLAGVVAGLLPASRAAAITPVQALRS